MIKIIRVGEGYTLVEWEEDGTKVRGKLPFSTDKVDEEMLSLALPYGDVWSDIVFPYILPAEEIAERLDTELCKLRIFTKYDLHKASPNVVMGALLRAFNIDYNSFLKMVDNYYVKEI